MWVLTKLAMAGAATALALEGCGGGGGHEATSCNFRGAGLCVDYPVSEAQDIQQVRSNCMDAGGTWEACPSAALAGTCRKTVGEEPFLTVHYYAGNICSASEGEARCSASADPDLDLRTTFTAGEASCGPATDRTLICDCRARDSTCVTAIGAVAPERVAIFERSCALRGALAEACPAGAIATCVSTDDLTGIEVTDRYYPGADLGEAQLDCEASGGTWSASS